MKKFFSIITVLLIVSISILPINASTVFYSDGFYFEEQADGTYMITDYDGISDVSIPGSLFSTAVTSIKARAFRNDSYLTSLSFDSAYSLTTINMYAFAGCTGIKSVIVPSTIKNIGISVFKDCVGLESAEFYGNRFTVPNETFSGCTKLRTAKISNEVVEIGAFAFANCNELEYLELPKTISIIGNNAFFNDNNLTLGVWNESYAHQYCEQNRIDHKILDRQPGDVNGDGVVDIFDATEIQKYAAERTDFDDEQFAHADLNHDGYVDVMDALLVQKSTVGMYEIPEDIIRY